MIHKNYNFPVYEDYVKKVRVNCSADMLRTHSLISNGDLTIIEIFAGRMGKQSSTLQFVTNVAGAIRLRDDLSRLIEEIADIK